MGILRVREAIVKLPTGALRLTCNFQKPTSPLEGRPRGVNASALLLGMRQNTARVPALSFSPCAHLLSGKPRVHPPQPFFKGGGSFVRFDIGAFAPISDLA